MVCKSLKPSRKVPKFLTSVGRLRSELHIIMASKILPYIAFGLLCLIFGSSYAVVSRALYFVDGNILSFCRMWFACLTGFSVLAFRFFTDQTFRSHVESSYQSGSVSMKKILLCGILNQGLPHSLITVAQRSLPSVAVTIAQPCVSLFAVFAAHFLLPDERFHCRKLIPQLLALTGTALTSIPTLSPKGVSAVAPQLLDFGLLGGAICSFGIGTVYVKLALTGLETVFCSPFQLLGSALYTSVFAASQLGLEFMFVALRNIGWNTIGWSLLMGTVFTYASGLLFVYVVRELGAVKAGFANFGQIVIGVIAGVVFLEEWKEYSGNEVAVSFVGLGLLTVSIFSGFFIKERARPRGEPEAFGKDTLL
jgi:drug/metabolite transporter (DMT)-like permease